MSGGGGGKPVQINNTENKVGALHIQSSTQGGPVFLAYGTVRITPNMIWYGDFKAIQHVTTTQSGGGGGGKGGGGGGGGITTTDITYTYTVAALLALCEGPIGYLQSSEGPPVTIMIGRIWSGKEHVAVAASGFSQFSGTWGASGQIPFSYLTTNHPTEAISYRNTAYVANGAIALGSQTSIPNFSFETYGLLVQSQCAPDVNPANIAVDMLTAQNYGAGFPSVYLGSLADFKLYCEASNFLCSPLYNAQRPMADILTELCLIGNSAVVWSEGILKIRPYGDETVRHTPSILVSGNCTAGTEAVWIPDLTPAYALSYDDFVADAQTMPITVTRKRQSDTYNQVQIEVLDRSDEYNVFVAEASDLANVELYGLRPAQPQTVHAICNANIGRSVAQAYLQRMLYVRNEYAFQIGWKYARLEPMDIVTLTEPLSGLDHYPVRITVVEEDEDGLLSITAEDLSEGAGSPGVYDAQQTGGSAINTGIAPGDAAAPVIFQPPVELTGVPQIWLATAGGAYWGGAEVWVSDDDTTYSQAGKVTGPARFGSLTANLPSGSDPDTTHTISVDLSASLGVLTSASTTAADAGDTLSYVDGELVAYSTAVLTSAYNYDLTSYIRRGLRCSFDGSHIVGSKFVRLDSAVGKFGVTLARVGNTIYVKLLSFNIYGGGKQSLDDVTPHTYVVQPLGIVAANGTVPDVIEATQALCIQPGSQISVAGRMTVYGRINCDGKLIVL